MRVLKHVKEGRRRCCPSVAARRGAAKRASYALRTRQTGARVQCGISQFTNQVGTRYIPDVVNL